MSWFTWLCFIIGLIFLCYTVIIITLHFGIVIAKTISYHIWVVRVAKLNGKMDSLKWRHFPKSIWTRILDFNECYTTNVTHRSGSKWESTFKYTIRKGLTLP